MEEINPQNLEEGQEYYIEKRDKTPGTSGKLIGTFRSSDFDDLMNMTWVSFSQLRAIEGARLPTGRTIGNNMFFNSEDYIFYKPGAQDISFRVVMNNKVGNVGPHTNKGGKKYKKRRTGRARRTRRTRKTRKIRKTRKTRKR